MKLKKTILAGLLFGAAGVIAAAADNTQGEAQSAPKGEISLIRNRDRARMKNLRI